MDRVRSDFKGKCRALEGTPAVGKLSGASTRSAARVGGEDSRYLVDPASRHMLVSKIKPYMSKYKQVCTVKLRMAH